MDVNIEELLARVERLEGKVFAEAKEVVKDVLDFVEKPFKHSPTSIPVPAVTNDNHVIENHETERVQDSAQLENKSPEAAD